MFFDIFSHRIAREQRTMACMLAIYCRAHHATKQLCPACEELLRQVHARLARCPFGMAKPTCSACCRNCHPTGGRERLRAIMRFAGPRMIWRHPLLAILHLLDSRRSSRAAQNKPPGGNA